MNIILFSPDEDCANLSLKDRRAVHMLKVLKIKQGDSVYCGIIDGAISSSIITSISDKVITISHSWNTSSLKLYPLELIIGTPRPQTVKKILFECSSLGISHFHFFSSQLGEKSYAQSKLWTDDLYKESILLGTEQSFSTSIPKVTTHKKLINCLDEIDSTPLKIALDNNESYEKLSSLKFTGHIQLAIGSERGWSQREREILKLKGFIFAKLGARVLRVETACVGASSICLAKMGYL